MTLLKASDSGCRTPFFWPSGLRSFRCLWPSCWA
ncbi:hypothetical protein [Ruegeria sp. HKCCA6837]